jgi:hypothetical protein
MFTVRRVSLMVAACYDPRIPPPSSFSLTLSRRIIEGTVCFRKNRPLWPVVPLHTSRTKRVHHRCYALTRTDASARSVTLFGWGCRLTSQNAVSFGRLRDSSEESGCQWLFANDCFDESRFESENILRMERAHISAVVKSEMRLRVALVPFGCKGRCRGLDRAVLDAANKSRSDALFLSTSRLEIARACIWPTRAASQGLDGVFSTSCQLSKRA